MEVIKYGTCGRFGCFLLFIGWGLEGEKVGRREEEGGRKRWKRNGGQAKRVVVIGFGRRKEIRGGPGRLRMK